MLQNTKKKKAGVTLLEILVGLTIMIAVSIVCINLLYDTLTIRSKQYVIQQSGESLRLVFEKMRDAVVYGDLISVTSSTQLQVQGSFCTTIRYNADNSSIEQAVDQNPSCEPPSTNFTTITEPGMKITSFVLSPVVVGPKNISVEIKGVYKNYVSDYEFDYKTSLTPRITL